MKKLCLEVLAVAAVLGLAFWALDRADQLPLAAEILNWIERAHNVYVTMPLTAVTLFCAAHLCASVLGIPGGCTFLNVLGGALFGFWMACAVIYPVTLLSAVIVYALAAHLRERAKRWLGRFDQSLVARLARNDFAFLVAVRLSPLLPFNSLNLLFGALHVPFRLFFFSTAVGIFFDVTVLATLGAGLRASGATTTREPYLAVAFAVLFLVFYGLRKMARVFGPGRELA